MITSKIVTPAGRLTVSASSFTQTVAADTKRGQLTAMAAASSKSQTRQIPPTVDSSSPTYTESTKPDTPKSHQRQLVDRSSPAYKESSP
jgi:hypothetical protein